MQIAAPVTLLDYLCVGLRIKVKSVVFLHRFHKTKIASLRCNPGAYDLLIYWNLFQLFFVVDTMR